MRGGSRRRWRPRRADPGGGYARGLAGLSGEYGGTVVHPLHGGLPRT